MPRPPTLPGETQREYCWRVFDQDAKEILQPAEAHTTRCKQALCQATIWWGVTKANNRRCPFDVKPDGTRTGCSHWRTCRDRPERKL